jgi:lipopolysaccharide export system protein LptA
MSRFPLTLPRRVAATSLLTALIASGMLMVKPAHAERADRERPITLEADHMTIDDLKKIQVYEGNVVLTQGTLLIRADKIVVTQDADGFSHGVATVDPPKLASFREKRDGVDEYVEGWGERIVYDAKSDKAELFQRARLKRNLDEARGDYISYDGKTSFYQVNTGDPTAKPSVPGGRVIVVLQPKSKAPAVPAKPEPDRGSTALKPSDGIAKPRED